jgi:hypothetical protein
MLNVSPTSKLTSATATNGLQTSATILESNPGRTFFTIQNQDTHALNLAFGVTASSSVYHLVLKACSGAADGSGGVISMESGAILSMAVTGYAQGGGALSYTVIETSDN